MARRKINLKVKRVEPDIVYDNLKVSKFINCLMMNGKKSLSQKIFYRSLDIISKKITEEDPHTVFQAALENVRPQIEVKPKRMGASIYQIPIEVRPQRKLALAIKWIIKYARSRNGKTIQDKLADEIIDAYKNTGGAIKKKEDIKKIADANRAFSHYRW